VTKRVPDPWRDLFRIQAGYAVAGLCGAAALPLVARNLGPTDYGRFTLFLTLAQVLFAASNNWTAPAVVRFGAEARARSGFMGDALGGRLAIVGLGLGLTGAATVLIPGAFTAYTGLPAGARWLLLLLLAVWLVADAGMWTLQAQGQVGASVEGTAVDRLCFVILVAAAALLAGLGLSAALWIVLSAKLGQIAWNGAWLAWREIWPLRIDRDTVRRILGYSWPVLGTHGVSYLVTLFEPRAIAALRSIEDLARYRVANQAAAFVLTAATAPWATFVFPTMARLRAAGADEVVRWFHRRLVPQVALLSGLAACLLTPWVPPVYRAVFSDAFAGGEAAATILVATLALQVAAALLSPLLAALDLTRRAFGISAWCAGVFGVGLATLVPAWGLAGAAWNWWGWYAILVGGSVRALERSLAEGASPRGSASAYVAAAAPALPIALATIADLPLGPRLAAAAGALGLTVWWARRHGLFGAGDLERLLQLDPPRLLRAPLALVYRTMIAPPAAARP
jgi:O-antigen/teichoic acid export membrane protein